MPSFIPSRRAKRRRSSTGALGGRTLELARRDVFRERVFDPWRELSYAAVVTRCRQATFMFAIWRDNVDMPAASWAYRKRRRSRA